MNTYSHYDYRIQGKERALSAEQLLTMFNRNISKNAELLDYIGKNNIFGIIAKTRNESVHSRFVAELLSGDFLEGNSRESTFMHFLDILLYRAGKEGKIDEISEHLRKAVLTRSVMFEKMVSECELTVTDYQKLYSSVNTQKVSEKDDRIDIYLKFNLLTPVAGRHELEVFIENKVNSSEFDAQTVRYFEACDNCGHKRPFQLFVYLTPQPVRDMDQYSGMDKKLRPESPHYIHICYQDILDYVIEPLLIDDKLDADKKAILKEYVGCLELPAKPDADCGSSNNDFSIMAISSRERQLVKAFMEDGVNRWLVAKAIEAKLSEPLYSVVMFEHLLNAEEALQSALQHVITVREKPLDVLKCVNECSIVGPQNGSEPFLIYSPRAWRSPDNKLCKYLPYDGLFVYSGRAYPSVSTAVAAAIKDYKEKHNTTNEQLIQLFSGIYSAKGGGIPLVSDKKQKGNRETDMQGIFVRKDVAESRLPEINAILGKKLSVLPIDNETYMNLMQCNTQVAINIPVTENGLPKEIDDLVEDVVHYKQVGTTDFFFRKDIKGDKILKLNHVTIFTNFDLIYKYEDTSLLLDFFKSRRNLILSVYKIMLEAEHDNKVYEEKLKIYRKLIKP